MLGLGAFWHRMGFLDRPAGRYFMIALVFLGIGLRLLLSWYGVGSNDARSFISVAPDIANRGLLNIYREQFWWNHVPVTMELAVLMNWLAVKSSLSPYFALRLPHIIADLGSCLLLQKIYTVRLNNTAGWVVAALYACSLDAILMSGYHGNFDSVYAFFSLLAFYFVVERKHYFYGGLALAAAINIKLIPVLLIPAIFIFCRNRRDFLYVMYGLSIGVLPYLWPLIGAREAFVHNVLGYKSFEASWGIPYIILLVANFSYGIVSLAVQNAMPVLHSTYITYGRHIIVLAVVGVNFYAWRKSFYTAYELAAMVMSLFLIFTPGFGVQYTAAVVPLLFAARPLVGAIYGAASGILLFITYWQFWDGAIPAYSHFDRAFPISAAWAGVVAWGVLVYFVCSTIWRKTISTKNSVAS